MQWIIKIDRTEGSDQFPTLLDSVQNFSKYFLTLAFNLFFLHIVSEMTQNKLVSATFSSKKKPNGKFI